jgi:hypothetical protein
MQNEISPETRGLGETLSAFLRDPASDHSSFILEPVMPHVRRVADDCVERRPGQLARADGEKISKYHVALDQVGVLADVPHAGVVDIDPGHEVTWLVAALAPKVGRSRLHERAPSEARVEDTVTLANDGPLDEHACDVIRRVVCPQQSTLGNGGTVDLKRTDVVGAVLGASGRGLVPFRSSCQKVVRHHRPPNRWWPREVEGAARGAGTGRVAAARGVRGHEPPRRPFTP